MLQALPEHCPADALVDARQALVRRVVAAAPVDVRPAWDRRRREQRGRRLWSPWRVLPIFGVSEMISSIVRVPGGTAEALNPSKLLRSR